MKVLPPSPTLTAGLKKIGEQLVADWEKRASPRPRKFSRPTASNGLLSWYGVPRRREHRGDVPNRSLASFVSKALSEATMHDRFAKTPEPPYYAVIFTSQRTDGDDGYSEMASAMHALALAQPGCLARKARAMPPGSALRLPISRTKRRS